MAKEIAIFGGSFNPPGEHHRAIARLLSDHFDEIVVVPCGPRPDKPITNDVEPVYRAAMVDMTFRATPSVRVELFDLEESSFTRTHDLDQRFRHEGTIWHVVGTDLVQGGAEGSSAIHRTWKCGVHLWHGARFAVIKRPGYELDVRDLPPQSRVIEIAVEGASSAIRERVFRHLPIENLVRPEVARYIERHGLYRGSPPLRSTRLALDEFRPWVIMDERNPVACAVAKDFPTSSPDPNLILVIGGDGTMLRAIRQHWRRRLPFFGINAGHTGFLLNNVKAPFAPGEEFVLQQLPLLWVETEDAHGMKKTALAFNDAWVERAAGQTAWLQVTVNGQERLPQLVADGVLVATAAGSTSYASAMGATPVPLNTPALLLVGSNVLRPTFWRPVVLPQDSVVEVRTLDPAKRPLRGFIDGVAQGEVLSMKARASNIAAVELAFDPRFDPAEKLAHIQFPPPGS